MVQPDALIGVGRGAILPLQVGLYSRDEALVAWHHCVGVPDGHHSTRGFVIGTWNSQGPIRDLDSLRSQLLEVLGLQYLNLA